jgi:hypothetical protein
MACTQTHTHIYIYKYIHKRHVHKAKPVIGAEEAATLLGCIVACAHMELCCEFQQLKQHTNKYRHIHTDRRTDRQAERHTDSSTHLDCACRARLPALVAVHPCGKICVGASVHERRINIKHRNDRPVSLGIIAHIK